MGYGLKYTERFNNTNLGIIGKTHDKEASYKEIPNYYNLMLLK